LYGIYGTFAGHYFIYQRTFQFLQTLYLTVYLFNYRINLGALFIQVYNYLILLR